MAAKQKQGATNVVSRDGITYIHCDLSDPFVHPTIPADLTAEQINASLNLNLGMPLLNPSNSLLRRCMSLLNTIFVSWWEVYAFSIWNHVPISMRRRMTFNAWRLYLPLHKMILGTSTGIHKDASAEYHALTTIMWWGRLFPVSVLRMRFALSQLSVWSRDEVVSRVERVAHTVELPVAAPVVQVDHMTVRGLYIHSQEEKLTEQVIFWLYGGAFLSGCVDGNLSPAESVARRCGKDVFLPKYRLLPEHTVEDMLWDAALAYHYLTKVRGVQPRNIILFGISSGAGLCVRLLQFIGELQRKEELRPAYISTALDATIMPGGAVLMCPFVDYTEPKGTMQHYQLHDLVVNQSVTELGFPFFKIALGDDKNRRLASPVHRSFQGLPPLCIVVSQHEVVYDQTIALVNQARLEGVAVSLGVWHYMCHVFCFLSSFIPEGEQSMDFVCDWIDLRLKDKNE